MTIKKRKCFKCKAIMIGNLSDYHLADWNAFSIGNQKTIVACPKHTKELIDYVIEKYKKGE